jgi:hypothetical protein
MDMVVLTAAIKVHREVGRDGRFPHHAMVVSGSPRLTERDATLRRLDALWKSGDYNGSEGRSRLRTLYPDERYGWHIFSLSSLDIELAGRVANELNDRGPALNITRAVRR